ARLRIGGDRDTRRWPAPFGTSLRGNDPSCRSPSYHWVGRDDHQHVFGLIWFHDDVPGPAAVSRSDDSPALLHVAAETRCVLEHLSEVDLLSIDHALEDMRRELELPIPPWRPPHPGCFYHQRRRAKTSEARSAERNV